jgi:chemotaxis signal transduction protein
VPADQFDPPPTVMGQGSRDFITAVGRMEEKLVIMIDVDRILSTEEMSQIDGSLHAAAKEQKPAMSGTEPAMSRA